MITWGAISHVSVRTFLRVLLIIINGKGNCFRQNLLWIASRARPSCLGGIYSMHIAHIAYFAHIAHIAYIAHSAYIA